MNAPLIRAAASLLNISPETIQGFRAASGGLNNRVYRFEAGAAVYFLRVPTPASRRFANAANEIAVYAALEGTGIADKAVRIDPDSGIKLSVAETDVRTMDPRSEAEIAAAVTALRKLHLLSVPGLGKESLFERIRRFDRIVNAEKIGIASDLRRRMETLLKSEERLTGRPRVPVHGDALPENILIRPDGSAVLIDFEFAALGDPLEDLAALYCHLPPDANDPGRLLYRYLNREPTGTEIHLLFAYAQLTALSWHLWAQFKIHAAENAGAVERYDRLMTETVRRNEAPPIPENLRAGGLRP